MAVLLHMKHAPTGTSHDRCSGQGDTVQDYKTHATHDVGINSTQCCETYSFAGRREVFARKLRK